MSFKLGASVYVKTDPNQEQGIVISKREYIGGSVTYTCGWNGIYVELYEQELTTEPDPLKALGITNKDCDH